MTYTIILIPTSYHLNPLSLILNTPQLPINLLSRLILRLHEPLMVHHNRSQTPHKVYPE